MVDSHRMASSGIMHGWKLQLPGSVDNPFILTINAVEGEQGLSVYHTLFFG